MQDTPKILYSSPLFAGISKTEMPLLLSCLSPLRRQYKKGSFVFLEGDPAGKIGILLDGSLQILQEDYLGRRTILSELLPGELFAETFACAHVAALPVSVQATSASDVLLFDYAKTVTTCPTACAFHTRLIDNMLLVLARKNLFFNTKLSILSKRTMREKLLAYLFEQAKLATSPSFSIPFNRQELADYLSVDRSALSAELSRMQAQGALLFHKNQFTLLDPPE